MKYTILLMSCQDRKLVIINLLLSIQATVVMCSSMGGGDEIESKYVTSDGIKILREDYENFVNNQETEWQKKEKKHRSIEDEIFQREYELDQQEDEKYSQKFPKRCHVCKIFVEEFLDILEKNATKDGNGNYIYKSSLFSDALEESCENMNLYAVTRTSSFRYKKGSSVLRQAFNEAQEGSKIKTWSYTLPPSNIDDPTGEIQRLTEKCEKLTRYHGRRNILRWLEQHSDIPLVDWFCRGIYLKKNRKECLTKTIKKDHKQRKDEL